MEAASGHVTNRIQYLTQDTKKALVQTVQRLLAFCLYLLRNSNYKYVLLSEIQSDLLEGKLSVYRQSTGANSYMITEDVSSDYKHRLTGYVASNLQTIDVQPERKEHTCLESAIGLEDAAFIEMCITDVILTVNEECSVAYVVG